MTPKAYKFRFIEPGIISYADQNLGIVLVSKEALDNMAPSFKGCPVIFVPEHHDDSDKETAFNFEDLGANPPSGIVSGTPYWGDDGWQWVDGLIWDEGAISAIDTQDYNVSCAYMPEETSDGGIWHELDYDSAVVNGKYMHMAIVPRPRYEGSRILANSKGGLKNMGLFGIKPKDKTNAAPPAPPKAAPAAPAKEPDGDEGGSEKPVMVNDDAEVDVNGTPVPLHELIAAYMESQGGAPAALADEDTVQLPDGTKVTVADLKAAYGAGGESAGAPEEPEESMTNAEAPTDTNAELPNQVKKNSAPAKRTVNAALRNAAGRSEDNSFVNDVDSETNRLARGSARYTIPAKNGGNK